jgi:4-amino-4-deoxy-L-arabinose transferase-like glycosyltransferase
LFTAQTYLQLGFSAALDSYPWPFFSILIAISHQLTGLPLHVAAHIIVSLCFFISSYAFVRLVAALGGSKRVQWFALTIILFHPLLADYRSSTTRDPGMWAFMLLSLLALSNYSYRPALR